jgi:hypothetical protein
MDVDQVEAGVDEFRSRGLLGAERNRRRVILGLVAGTETVVEPPGERENSRHQADLLRLQACWNACEAAGLTTAELTRGVVEEAVRFKKAATGAWNSPVSLGAEATPPGVEVPVSERPVFQDQEGVVFGDDRLRTAVVYDSEGRTAGDGSSGRLTVQDSREVHASTNGRIPAGFYPGVNQDTGQEVLRDSTGVGFTPESVWSGIKPLSQVVANDSMGVVVDDWTRGLERRPEGVFRGPGGVELFTVGWPGVCFTPAGTIRELTRLAQSLWPALGQLKRPEVRLLGRKLCRVLTVNQALQVSFPGGAPAADDLGPGFVWELCLRFQWIWTTPAACWFQGLIWPLLGELQELRTEVPGDMPPAREPRDPLGEIPVRVREEPHAYSTVAGVFLGLVLAREILWRRGHLVEAQAGGSTGD